MDYNSVKYSYKSSMGDIQARRNMLIEAFSETFLKSYGRKATQDELLTLISRLDIALKSDDAHFYLFFGGEELLGYYWIELRVPRIAYLLDMFLHERYRGKGHGSVMWNHILKKSKQIGANRLKFIVSENNHAAYTFYKGKGASPRQYRKDGSVEWCEMILNLD